MRSSCIITTKYFSRKKRHQSGKAVRKFLAEWLAAIPGDEVEVVEWRGGKAHNIIPRDAAAVVTLSDPTGALAAGHRVRERWTSFLPANDRSLTLALDVHGDSGGDVVAPEDLAAVLGFLLAFPHGAHAYDLPSNRELVALSNNLAKSLLVRDQFYLLSSLRFFDRGECVSLEERVRALARGFGLTVSSHGEYPSWKPVRENALLDLVAGRFEALFNRRPKVTAIHAGLECGILRDRIGPIDAVSFGPTITGAHSPQERVHAPSVEGFWELLREVLRAL